MKTTAFAVALLGFLPAVFAQDAAPSPTESYGCEPHGDHWHCEGARTATENNVVSTPAAVATTAAHDDDHDHASGTGAMAPSPTESIGCEPHGDHWHCEGPRTTPAVVVVTTSAAVAVTTSAHAHEDHTDSPGTGSMAPSPTASVGCEPHGDHWHCEGPRTSGAAVASTPVSKPDASASAAATSQPATQVVNGAGLEMVPIVGMFAAAILAI